MIVSPIAKIGVKWKVVITGNSGAESAEVITRELKENPEIKVVLCTGQADTEGAGIAISKHFTGQGYLAAGFDLTEKILKFIKQGHIAFTIDQQPYIHGFYPVIQLTLYKRYGIMPSDLIDRARAASSKAMERIISIAKPLHR